MKLLSKLADPARWQRFIVSRIELYRRDRADDALDRVFATLGPVKFTAGDNTVVADGMWRNANHFFRLRLFVEALAGRGEQFRLLGVLRSRADKRERRALERIGFKDFIFIDEDDEFRTEQFLVEADRMLSGVHSHNDLLRLALPHELPAYTFYDTVLKLSSHPQTPLSHPLWRITMAETLRNVAIYDRELSLKHISHVVLSHPWKDEWATLTWLSLEQGIATYHLTGFCEAIRIRRFRSQSDYATPVEHLSRAAFESLPHVVQGNLAKIGSADLLKRASGDTSDINARHAFDPSRRIEDRATARLSLSGQTEKPVAIIYGHVWYDFPHTFAMRNFTDFQDWIEATLRRIHAVDDVIWLLKPHPTEQWYGGFRLTDIVSDLPPHIRLLPRATDSQTAMTAADTIVTVHGTVGLEAAANGVSVILADRSYFSDWGIAHVAQSRDHYLDLLGQVEKLSPPDGAARERAKACFALGLAEPPVEIGALPISCDSNGSALYAEIAKRYASNAGSISHEVARIAEFIDQSEIDSFAAFHLVKSARRVVEVEDAA